MVITIGGNYGSGGKALAERAAEMLGYTLCDDEVIKEVVKDSGVDMTTETFAYFDESSGKSSLSEIQRLSSVQSANYRSMISSIVMDVAPLDKRMNVVQARICKALADKGNCIILGRCADYYLRGRDDVISIFVTNTPENCVKRIMEHFSIDEKAAKKVVKKTDERRSDYYSFFTGKRWADLNNYNIVLQNQCLGDEGCARLLKAVVEIKESCKA